MNKMLKSQPQQTGQPSLAAACLASCQKIAAQIEAVKNNLFAEPREIFTASHPLFDRVVAEAEALAWQTDYPHLFFPALAWEKIQNAADWKIRQQSLLKNREAYALAA